MKAFDNLKIISAGAGSGKTFRLTSEMVRLLEEGVRPSGIIATTFTNKAAAELQERVRLRLLENGMPEQADELTNALIGTVHGLGVKLLKRFSYEAGVSPEVSIIADEDQQLLFNQSLATVLSENRVIRMESLCDRLGLSENEYFDWRREVKTLTDIARSNDFSTGLLETSKRRSIETLTAFFGQKNPAAGENTYSRLRELLERTITAIQQSEDGTKTTEKVLNTLKTLNRELQLRSYLKWPQWARMAKLKPGAKSRELVEELVDFASRHDELPDFHDDIGDFLSLLFDIVIAALEEFEQYKKQRGLIDYIDMEVLIKNLLDNEQVQQILREELDLLMVDEFQDTSPIQLEIFLKLSRFARYSVWVGDPKQSIYGFRGADPRIMQAIIKQTGGIRPEDIQEYSWRSREDLVHATNALFTRAFPGLPKEQVALKPKRKKTADAKSLNKKNEPLEMTNALVHWHFKFESEGSRRKQPGKPWHENAIAGALREFLEALPYIQPKGEKEVRPARAGDVAVLCRSNKECMEMAEALYQAGFKVSISRAGLLQTAEAQLILACLKLILNPNDALSTAEILKLAEGESLENIIESRLDYLEKTAMDDKFRERWARANKYIQQLDDIRPDVVELSTTEILELLLEELDLRRVIVSWGNAPKRLDNVDILRQLSGQYEENCNRLHAPASLGGFLLYLNELGIQGNDKQGSGSGPDAIDVLTYHKSKGLEWPIVICHSLEKSLRSEVWGADIVATAEEVDLNDILGNRWLRYWVNPYGLQHKSTPLYERLQDSEARRLKEDQARAEEARLLYVGLTRARDYLIFTSTSKPTKWLNRVWHDGKDDYPTLDPDSQESPWIWNEEILPVDTTVFTFDEHFETFLPEEAPIYFLAPPAGKLPHPPRFFDLRNESIRAEFEVRIPAGIQYGHRPQLKSEDEPYLCAKTVKAFLTAYQNSYNEEELVQMGEELTLRHESEDFLDPQELVRQAHHWWRYLEEAFTIRADYRKYPLWHFYKGRIFRTVVDLILETEEGLIIIQHSSFSGDQKNWRNKALELADWFFLVKDGLRRQFPYPHIRTYVHFVLAGAMMEVSTTAAPVNR